jgi:hypothetical protein
MPVPNPVKAETREELQRLLRQDTRKIIITTIFKFGEPSGGEAEDALAWSGNAEDLGDRWSVDNHVRCNSVIGDGMNPSIAGAQRNEALEYAWTNIGHENEDQREGDVAPGREYGPSFNQVHQCVGDGINRRHSHELGFEDGRHRQRNDETDRQADRRGKHRLPCHERQHISRSRTNRDPDADLLSVAVHRRCETA